MGQMRHFLNHYYYFTRRNPRLRFSRAGCVDMLMMVTVPVASAAGLWRPRARRFYRRGRVNSRFNSLFS